MTEGRRAPTISAIVRWVRRSGTELDQLGVLEHRPAGVVEGGGVLLPGPQQVALAEQLDRPPAVDRQLARQQAAEHDEAEAAFPRRPPVRPPPAAVQRDPPLALDRLLWQHIRGFPPRGNPKPT